MNMDVVALTLLWTLSRVLAKIPRIGARCTCEDEFVHFRIQRARDIARMTKVAYLMSKFRGTQAEDVLRSLRERGYTMMTSKELFSGHDEMENMKQLLEAPSCHVVVFREGTANRFFVAVRGTNLRSWRDWKEDIGITFEMPHHGHRVAEVRKLVGLLAEIYGNGSVTVTGHSLGAIVGFIVEREFYLKNHQLRDHLQPGHYFNLPFMPVDRVLLTILCRAESQAMLLRKATISERFLKGAAALAAFAAWWAPHDEEPRFMHEFHLLEDWSPNLYVQDYDTISQSILNYFEDRELGDYGQANTTFTPMLVRFGARALQHLPSARFIIANHGVGTLTSHPLSNWIRADCFRVRFVRYRNLQPQPFFF